MSDPFEQVTAATASDLAPYSNAIATFFRTIFGDNDAAVAAMATDMRDEIIVQLQQDVDDLKKAVEAQGKQLDDLDPLTVAGHLDRLGREAFRTASDDKRRALIAVTAGQFAPYGSRGSRQFWLSKVAELSDLEAEAMTMMMNDMIIAVQVPQHKVRVVTENQWLATAPDKKRNEDITPRVSKLKEGLREELSNADFTYALHLALTSLRQQKYVRYDIAGNGRLARLTPVGKQLAAAMRGWKDVES